MKKSGLFLALMYGLGFSACGGGGGAGGAATASPVGLPSTASATPLPSPSPTPSISKALPINVVSNVRPTHPLAHVRSFEYVIQNQTEGARIARLAASPADLVVIDVPSSVAGTTSYNSAADVATIKNSYGAAGHKKIVLAYLDIGEAEEYRAYWNPSWKWSDTPSMRTTPSWIVAKDPDGWTGNYPVAFWTQAWKDIMYDTAGSAIDRIVAAGYDGVYMDWVEAHSFAPVIAQARAAGIDPDQAMIDFIAALRAKARQVNPNFLVIAQNATALRVYPRYMALLDGQGQEQAFFDGTATSGSPTDPTQGDCALPLHRGDPPPASNPSYCASLGTLGGSSEEYVLALADYLQAGIPVFTIDYALDRQHVAFTYAQDSWFHFIGLVTMRSLSDLTATPLR